MHENLEIIPSGRTPFDYETLAEIANLIYSDYPAEPADWKNSDENRQEKHLYKRFLLRHTAEDRIVGYGVYSHTHWAFHPDRYFLEIIIRPEDWGKGYGKYLHDQLLSELMKHNPASIESDTRENLPRGIRFITERGYTLKTTEYSSALELSQFDSASFTPLVEKLRGMGYTFQNFAQFREQNPDDYLKKYYNAFVVIDLDIPWHEKITPDPYEVFEKKFHTRAHKMIDECYVFAIFEGEIVGMTMLTKSPADPTKLYTGLSGVFADHRRKGLVTALKAISLGWAKDNLATAEGVLPAVFTENEENNPMYTINEKMGFVRQPSFLIYTKDLT